MAWAYWKTGILAGCLALFGLCACSPIGTIPLQTIKETDEKDPDSAHSMAIPAVEHFEESGDGVLTSWSLIHPPPASQYPGLSFSLTYADEDGDGYMETLFLTVGVGDEPYRFLLRDVNKDGSPDRVTCSKALSGVYTTDLDGDGRFDYYNDVEAGKVKIFAEGSLIEVMAVEGIEKAGVSSSKLPQAISVKDDTTYVFADGIWTRHE